MKGPRWFHGFTHPLRGVKPENQTQVSKPKTRVLVEQPTLAWSNTRIREDRPVEAK